MYYGFYLNLTRSSILGEMDKNMNLQKIPEDSLYPSYTVLLKTNRYALTGQLMSFSAKFFVLEVEREISLRELDRRAFLHFELLLKRNVKIIVRGKVKESFQKNLFFFEVRQVDYFQNEGFIGSTRIFQPIVSLSGKKGGFTGILEEISPYEMALSIRSHLKKLSIGQPFTKIMFQLGLSRTTTSQYFLKSITSNHESYILTLQTSEKCQTLNDVTAMLSTFNYAHALSPIFYSKGSLEKLSLHLLPSTIYTMNTAHRTLTTKADDSLPRETLLNSHWFHLNKVLCQAARKLHPNKTTPPQYITVENSFIPPQWTQPEISPTFFAQYIMAADELIGIEKTNLYLIRLGVDRSYFAQTSNWISADFFDEFVGYASKSCNSAILHKRAGKYFFLQEKTVKLYTYFKSICSSHMGFKKLGEIFSKNYRHITYNYKKLNRESGLVQISPSKDIPFKRHFCEQWKFILESYIQVVADSRGTVECDYDNTYCTYRVTCPRKKSLKTLFLPLLILICIGVHYIYSWAFIWLIPLLGVFFSLFLYMKSDRDKLIKELSSQKQDTFQKYDELQASKQHSRHMYNEARVITQLTSQINSSRAIEETLLFILKNICVKFNYHQAFILLSDSSKKFLKVKAAYGSNSVWNHSLSLERSPQKTHHIATAFHTKQPLVFTNLKHSSTNDKGKTFIEILQLEHTCLISIRANEKPLGVLIAERKSGPMITRRDYTLLERMGQILGLSIEKENRNNRESFLRESFQKFVPNQVVQDILEEKSDSHTQKDISVAFVDIREFTQITSQMPSDDLVCFLNSFYSLISTKAQETGGIIDKLLGDGALVLWGADEKYSDKESRAMKFVLEIKKGVHQLNKEHPHLPPFKIGVGMSSGKATVGVLGNDIRMAYTAVGPTVNLASRLEELCKTYNRDCMASIEFLNGLTPIEKKAFSLVQENYIRGVGYNIPIGVYHNQTHNKGDLL